MNFAVLKKWAWKTKGILEELKKNGRHLLRDSIRSGKWLLGPCVWSTVGRAAGDGGGAGEPLVGCEVPQEGEVGRSRAVVWDREKPIFDPRPHTLI